MALKPEVSLTVAAATAAVVYGIFQVEMGGIGIASVKGNPPHNPVISSSISGAGWTAAAVVAGISLLSKDATVFVVGGALAAGLTWRYKHASMVEPSTGKVTYPPTYTNGQTTTAQPPQTATGS